MWSRTSLAGACKCTAEDQEAEMTNSTSGRDAEVKKWLLKTGFPLEMRVINAFGEFPENEFAAVQANTYYVDPNSGQQREVDLILSWMKDFDDAMFLVSLTVECKSTNDPWVVFKRTSADKLDGSLFDPSFRHMFKCTSGAEEAAFYARLDLEGLLTDNLPDDLRVPTDGYSVVTAFKERNARDSADSAVRQVLSAAQYAGLPVEPEFSTRKWFCYSVPVIITTSPLYEAHLNEDGSDVDLRSVAVSAVSQPIPDDTGLNTCSVTIYNESEIEDLLSQCRHMQEMFGDLNASGGSYEILKRTQDKNDKTSG
jgi:hypothetical protein